MSSPAIILSSESDQRVSSGRERAEPAAAGGEEFTVTLRPQPQEGVTAFLRRIAERLQGATILHWLSFGVCEAKSTTRQAMQQVFGKVDWPVTWVEGGGATEGPIAGVQVWALTNGVVQRLQMGARVVGSIYSDGEARHGWLAGLGPLQRDGSRERQTGEMLVEAEAMLAEANFSLKDAVRTWFYLDDILSWYDGFNRVRTKAYAGIQFRSGALPASTGVGARNADGAALALIARLVQPLTEDARVNEVPSPLQCPASAYGSSFSRAMELTYGGRRQLLVSGTASIAREGETLWKADIQRQVDATMGVISMLLDTRGYAYRDVTRATAYFKRAADIRVFADWCVDHGLETLPVVPVVADVCREDLLFELEVDAQKEEGVG